MARFTTFLMTLLLHAWSLSTLSAQEPATGSVQAAFEALAAEVSYLSLGSVLFDRPDQPLLWERITDRAHPQAALLALLAHADPKVRTLAAVALFDREDPTVLPALVPLCADQAETFNGRPGEGASIAWGVVSSGCLPPLKQTVGSVVTSLVGCYLAAAGFHYGVVHKTEPGFQEYWSARQQRTYTAGWFAVQLARASGGMMPTPPDRVDRLRDLRRRLDVLPAEARTWVLLWLRADPGGAELATEEELVVACSGIGPERLLAMLHGRIPSDDPDLQERSNNNFRYKQMTYFILLHAAELLRPEDSEVLLACERRHLDYVRQHITDPTISGWWSVAAARLRPQDASRILYAAINRFRAVDICYADETALVVTAIWQLIGTTEEDYVIGWFYRTAANPRTQDAVRILLAELTGPAPDHLALVARLVQDSRLDHLNWGPLERLVRLVNGWTPSPIVSEDDLRKAWHPLGEHGVARDQASARREHPREYAELQGHLDSWRRLLRAGLLRLQEESRK